MPASAGGDRGAALVEFALLVPVLVMLVLGVVDLGRAYRLKAQLTNAAREGAAYAQYFPTRVDSSGAACVNPENVVFVARNETGTASSFGVSVTRASDGSAVTGCNHAAVAVGSNVVVRTSAPFNILTPLVAAVVGSPLTLRARVEMVVQG